MDTRTKFSVSQIDDKNAQGAQSSTAIFVNGFREKIYNLNDIKRRSTKIVKIPILLVPGPNNVNLYKNHKGSLESTIKYKEFYSSTNLKHEVMVFPLLDR